jgi:hypothetical protein
MRSLWLNFAKSRWSLMTPALAAIWRRSRMIIYLALAPAGRPSWLKRPLWQRIAERLFYFFSPLL